MCAAKRLQAPSLSTRTLSSCAHAAPGTKQPAPACAAPSHSGTGRHEQRAPVVRGKLLLSLLAGDPKPVNGQCAHGAGGDWRVGGEVGPANVPAPCACACTRTSTHVHECMHTHARPHRSADNVAGLTRAPSAVPRGDAKPRTLPRAQAAARRCSAPPRAAAAALQACRPGMAGHEGGAAGPLRGPLRARHGEAPPLAHMRAAC